MEQFSKKTMTYVIMLCVFLTSVEQVDGDSYFWSVYSAPSGGAITYPTSNTELCTKSTGITFTCTRGSDIDQKCHTHSPFDTTYPSDSMSSNHPRWTVSAGTLVTSTGTSVAWNPPSSFTYVTVRIYEDDKPDSKGEGDTGTRNDNEIENDSVTFEAFCPHPMEWEQTSATEPEPGQLRFTYSWDSTCGITAHLSDCRVGENVDYPGGGPTYYWPSAPWTSGTSTDDPTLGSLPGTWGGCQDTHYSLSFINPCTTGAGFTATQIEECHCSNCMGDIGDRVNWASLANLGSIVRTVYWVGAPDNTWRYKITKAGEESTKDLP